MLVVWNWSVVADDDTSELNCESISAETVEITGNDAEQTEIVSLKQMNRSTQSLSSVLALTKSTSIKKC